MQATNAEIDFAKLRLGEYRKIAFCVILEDNGRGRLEFAENKAALGAPFFKSVQFVFSVQTQQHREKYRAVLEERKGARVCDEELQGRIDAFVDHAIQEWLEPLALSKVPVVVTEICGHHIIAIIRGKGFDDKKIHATDWVLSNFRHEVKQLVHAGKDPRPEVLADII